MYSDIESFSISAVAAVAAELGSIWVFQLAPILAYAKALHPTSFRGSGLPTKRTAD